MILAISLTPKNFGSWDVFPRELRVEREAPGGNDPGTERNRPAHLLEGKRDVGDVHPYHGSRAEQIGSEITVPDGLFQVRLEARLGHAVRTEQVDADGLLEHVGDVLVPTTGQVRARVVHQDV